MNNILQVLGIAVAIAVGVWSVQERAQEKAQEKPAETPATATNTTPAATPASASSATAPVKKENPVKSSPECWPPRKRFLDMTARCATARAGTEKANLWSR